MVSVRGWEREVWMRLWMVLAFELDLELDVEEGEGKRRCVVRAVSTRVSLE